jgi:DNA-binding PadR family transcriptional regulator
MTSWKEIMPDPSNADRWLPLHPRLLAVLLALAETPMHGYALLRRIEERSDLGSAPGPTSLYRALHELEEGGLIEPAVERPDPHLDDERRRYYRVSAFGRSVIDAELGRLERVVAWARGEALAEGGS